MQRNRQINFENKLCRCLSWSCGEKRDDSGCEAHGSDVVDGGGEAAEDVEGCEDEQGQEHGVVEEDGVRRRLVLGNLIGKIMDWS